MKKNNTDGPGPGIKILYEDNHLIAVHKRPGQPVQPEDGKPVSVEEEVKQYIKFTRQKPGDVFLGVIHRLDMPVSGIVLLARTSKALVRMNALFQKRDVEKIYTACVNGMPSARSAMLTHYLVRDDSRRITKAYEKEVPGSQKAQLEYNVTGAEGKNAVLRIVLHTGRKHQIRAQLAKSGHPIVGDVKYNAPKALPDQSIALCATSLSFVHPVTKEKIVITTNPSW
jgi:23S rRNA pseudouridine1911/1915/1917 synthase